MTTEAIIKDLIERAVAAGVVTKSGNWYSFGEVRLGQGFERAESHLLENPDVATAVAAALGGDITTDPPAESKPDVGAAGAVIAPNAGNGSLEATQGEHTVTQEGFLTIVFPLPADAPPPEQLAGMGAAVIVRAKPERGRWRAGRFFTREETIVPLGEIADQLDVLTADPELVVAVRLPTRL